MAIRLGIIGLSADKAAWATNAHAVPLKAPPLSEKYTITAVATSSPESARAAAKSHGVPEEKAYSSPEAIANDPDVDMVVVSVKAKKDVFVEWPLANGLQEAEELAALAKKQGVKTVVGLQARLTPSILKAKEIIDSGALGRIITTSIVASTSLFQKLDAKNSYINDPKNGVNFITIPTAHALDPLCFLLGEFKSLNATAATNFPTVQFTRPDGTVTEPEKRRFVDSVAVQGVLESGTTVTFSSTTTTDATPGQFEWIIAGEKASLKFEAPVMFIVLHPPALYQYTPGEGAKWEEVEVVGGGGGGIGEVYAAFAEGKEGVVDFEEALKRHRMVAAIEKSAANGTRESY
ncbi:hypothetical protein OEA41_007435 [Lepraria neglecta]|uniref:Gfo/Idh/MocA-like oxidoreductase N-terminal domain-containing protein n=1 Tax=Lepraria neglecta TaxID=209136 RepID=A0AAE0DMY6_9LECA|nr:hypothetical protein OEA41_007435 [Lepraria neglecta]